MDYKLLSVLAAAYVAIYIITSMISVEARASTLSIKTEHGSIYDCVDIYKQPALEHPLLKDHKIQMQPSFAVPKRLRNISASSKIGLKDECPRGTVPILRTTKEEQIRAEFSFTEGSATGFEFAGIYTVPNNTKKFYGGGGLVTLYNPLADKGQLSSSVISIEGGPPEQFSTIRVGWMVNPSAFGDTKTRLFTLWAQGVDGTMHGCYDTRCSGFVVVSTKVQLNKDLSYRMEPGVFEYIELTVTQDKVTGNWWFAYGDDEFDGETETDQVGYWPSNLFTNLKDGAEIVRWGGMVYSNKPKSPPMGSGDENCHFRRLSLADSGSDAPLEKLESRCYKVGDKSSKIPYWGYSFWFGGPGGDTNECHS